MQGRIYILLIFLSFEVLKVVNEVEKSGGDSETDEIVLEFKSRLIQHYVDLITDIT